MEGISSFRNEIEMSFIFNVNRQQTTDNRQQTTDNRQQTTDNRLWVCIFSRRDAEENFHSLFLRRVNVCLFLWLH